MNTPQTLPIRPDQIMNAAGGYGYAKDLWTQLQDFLILGTTGGTYYVDQDDLTRKNATVLFDALAEDGPRVVALLTEASNGRAPKNRPALFALAAAYAEGDADTRQAAKLALPRVARTTDHLSTFFGYYKNLGGKPTERGIAPTIGRSLRTAIGSWFLYGDADDVAFKACKAMQRRTPMGETFSLRDALRIAHPVPDDERRKALFGWIAGNVTDDEARRALPAIDRFLSAKAVVHRAQAVRLVTEKRVPWEFLPDAMLTDPRVWAALIDTIGPNALLRNLARMTSIGTLKPLKPATRRAAERLRGDLGRVHPMDVFLAMRVYAAGEPVPEIMDALEEAYENSFGTVEPSGRRLLVAVDSSGSMSFTQVTLGGVPVGTVYEVACAMAVMLARIEGDNVHLIDVDTIVHPSRVTRRTSLREIASWQPSGGGTDLSLPFTWARKERLDVDGVVVFTDNETWAGTRHPSQALTTYRREVNQDTRVVVASLTPMGHTIGDPKDAGVLNVAGLDASLPMIVNAYIRQAPRRTG
ncbi:TROVE domain-containing protein [Nonomuraea sp. NPDC050556]|uniref:TROVE domain-containing protein n=1 Tax=Nonomuraea sp. NPDC050556 TaxID=3364369 RepID=UPI0037A0D465